MSTPPRSSLRSAIVTRLRAAGCVFAEDEAQLLSSAARTPADLAAMVDRRAAGLPIEHVLGWAQFCGVRIAVDPGVFVPRRRTEFLVHHAAELTPERAVVVDLCCGSGALGGALVAAAGGADRVELHAVDIDPAAVRCARRNLTGAGGRVYQGDLCEPLPATLRGRVDLLVANVPYVPTEAIGMLPPEARLHEPRVALDGGADGRSPADRDERAPGPADRRDLRQQRAGTAGGQVRRAGRDRRHRSRRRHVRCDRGLSPPCCHVTCIEVDKLVGASDHFADLRP